MHQCIAVLVHRFTSPMRGAFQGHLFDKFFSSFFHYGRCKPHAESDTSTQVYCEDCKHK
jgi:hypothetical protein